MTTKKYTKADAYGVFSSNKIIHNMNQQNLIPIIRFPIQSAQPAACP